MKFLFTLLLLTVSIMLGAAQAASVNALRYFTDNSKTRVVIDLDYKPKYATAFNHYGRTFVIRIKNLTNPKRAPAELKFSSKSAVSLITRVIDGKDVRYLFTLRRFNNEPKVFFIEDSKGGHRLVADFALNGGVTAEKAALTPAQRQADYERELRNSLSSVDKDGMRTMTPAQAKIYQQKLNEYKQKQAAALRQSREVEDEVLDTQAPPSPREIAASNDPFIVAIDPGHGGKDPGASGRRGVKEKNVTLAISRYLARYINSNRQFRSYMTRRRDVFIELNQRSELARRNKADILISIHADSLPSKPGTRGASIWVLSGNRAQRENKKVLSQNKQTQLLGGAGEVIAQSQDAENPYLAATILDMTSDNARSEGYTLAEEILKKIGGVARVNRRTPIHASLAVLKAPDIPSLLIETGFLSNKYDEIKLNQPNFQKQLAYAIYRGIVTYYQNNPAMMQRTRLEAARRSGSTGSFITHTVKRGDTLSGIARKYQVSTKSIMRLNQMSGSQVQLGRKLRIPRS